MLHQGRMELEGAKKTVEGVLEDVQALKGLWGWFIGLFTSKQPKPTTQKPVAKKANQPEPDADLLQMQTVHNVSQQLGKFFDIQQQITTHYKNLEETSLHVYEAGQNHAMKAIERVEVELQLEELTVQIRETMVYAPKELKDLYSRFLKMYGKIKEEQEFARQEQIAAARFKEAVKWQRRSFKIEVGMWAVGLAWVLAIVWGMLLQVALLTGSLG